MISCQLETGPKGLLVRFESGVTSGAECNGIKRKWSNMSAPV